MEMEERGLLQLHIATKWNELEPAKKNFKLLNYSGEERKVRRWEIPCLLCVYGGITV